MDYPICVPKCLPQHKMDDAAATAILENPANEPRVDTYQFSRIAGFVLKPQYESAITTKYWRTNGVHLSVQFLDNPDSATRRLILQHMNAWGTRANVSFSETAGQGQVRLSRQGGQNGGYWSYIGTDILQIDAGLPTMNLEGFTATTPEAEYKRVVRHETGHTCGFPHEHMRPELVALIDPQKAIAYFEATQGWSAEEVQAQVLTPLNPADLTALAPDQQSIMCYQIPGTITKSGQPILGGTDIDEEDYQLASQLYPLTTPAVHPPGPVVATGYTTELAVASVNKAMANVVAKNPRWKVFLQQLAAYIATVVLADAPGRSPEIPVFTAEQLRGSAGSATSPRKRTRKS